MSLPSNFFIGRGGGGVVGNPVIQVAGINVDLSAYASGTYVYTETRTGMWSLVVPANFGVSMQVHAHLWGAQGGSTSSSTPGYGGYMEGRIDLQNFQGQTLYIVVGGAGSSATGTNAPVATSYYTTGGYNGGGRGVSNRQNGNDTGGGGGATDIRLNGGVAVTDYANANRIFVAGGGGGSTSNTNCNGGGGGYPNGLNGLPYGGQTATGGTQSAGGNLNGSFGLGGENTNNTGWNGAGGGGWYGGGAHPSQHGPGAGGSGYYDSSYITLLSSTNNIRTGDGQFRLRVV